LRFTEALIPGAERSSCWIASDLFAKTIDFALAHI